MWCAVSQFGVVVANLVDGKGVIVTVNSEHYVSTLANYLQPQIEEIVEEEELWELLFQQDRVTAYTAQNSLNVLWEMFLRRVLSLSVDMGWPAWSPDLSIWDFFLWGYLYLKEKVFTHCPHTLPELRDRIDEVSTIPCHIFNRAIQNFRECLQLCFDVDCRHLGDIFFKHDEWCVLVLL